MLPAPQLIGPQALRPISAIYSEWRYPIRASSLPVFEPANGSPCKGESTFSDYPFQGVGVINPRLHVPRAGVGSRT